jgi:hypothetical protein
MSSEFEIIYFSIKISQYKITILIWNLKIGVCIWLVFIFIFESINISFQCKLFFSKFLSKFASFNNTHDYWSLYLLVYVLLVFIYLQILLVLLFTCVS